MFPARCRQAPAHRRQNTACAQSDKPNLKMVTMNVKFNTFGIEAFATEFCEVNSPEQLAEVLQKNQQNKFRKTDC